MRRTKEHKLEMAKRILNAIKSLDDEWPGESTLSISKDFLKKYVEQLERELKWQKENSNNSPIPSPPSNP